MSVPKSSIPSILNTQSLSLGDTVFTLKEVSPEQYKQILISAVAPTPLGVGSVTFKLPDIAPNLNSWFHLRAE